MQTAPWTQESVEIPFETYALTADAVREELAVELAHIDADISSAGGGSGLDESALHSALTSYTGKDDYKADISTLESRAEADAHYQNLIIEHTDTQAAIANLNDFDPTSEPVARVTLVDTVTTNTDMRGTDGASTVDPDNATITAIAADTSDLQSNQGDWITATGFSTHSAADIWSAATRSLTDNVTLSSTTLAAIATAVEQAILDEADGNQILNAIVGAIGNSNVDEIALVAAIRSDLERNGGTLDSAAAETTLLQQVASVQAAIASLNDFDHTTDTVARVTRVDTTIANSDMRGTDGANTVAPDNTRIAIIAADTNELQANQGDWATATGFSTHSVASVVAALQAVADDFKSDDVDLSPISAAIANLNDLSQAELASAATDITDQIADFAGLTPAQETILTFIRDVIEADETLTGTSAQKLLKGTDTVLVNKAVTSALDNIVDTTLIEATE